LDILDLVVSMFFVNKDEDISKQVKKEIPADVVWKKIIASCVRDVQLSECINSFSKGFSPPLEPASLSGSTVVEGVFIIVMIFVKAALILNDAALMRSIMQEHPIVCQFEFAQIALTFDSLEVFQATNFFKPHYHQCLKQSHHYDLIADSPRMPLRIFKYLLESVHYIPSLQTSYMKRENSDGTVNLYRLACLKHECAILEQCVVSGEVKTPKAHAAIMKRPAASASSLSPHAITFAPFKKLRTGKQIV